MLKAASGGVYRRVKHAAAGGLANAVVTSDGTNLTVQFTTGVDTTGGWIGFEYGRGEGAGTSSSKSVTGGAPGAQTITVALNTLNGYTGTADVWNINPYYNLSDPDGTTTRVKASTYGQYPTPYVYNVTTNATNPPVQGVTITGTYGVIAGPIGQTISQQWSRSNGGAYANIGGATATTYVPVSGDIGYTLKYTQTSTGQGLSTPATSAATSVVASAFKTLSVVQNWGVGSVPAATSLSKAFVAGPTGGNLIVAFAMCPTGNTITGISDDIGDAGTWTPLVFNPEAGTLANFYGFWKVVGTPGAGKTVTVTCSGSTTIELFTAECGVTSGTPTWALDGTATHASGNSTTPDPGSITTTSTSSWVIGYGSGGAGFPTAAAGYTRQATSSAYDNDAVEDRITTSATVYDPNWTVAAGRWSAIGVAFKAT